MTKQEALEQAEVAVREWWNAKVPIRPQEAIASALIRAYDKGRVDEKRGKV